MTPVMMKIMTKTALFIAVNTSTFAFHIFSLHKE